MPADPTTRSFVAGDATLTVRTGKTGAAAKAGHDLEIVVTSWQATLDLGAGPSLELTADPHSLRVVRGTGGAKPLDDGDKAKIAAIIDRDVLAGAPIAFRSSAVTPTAGGFEVRGELELAGHRGPVTFALALADGRLTGAATVRQTAWGIRPHSAMLGALKVRDEVEVLVDAPF